MANNIDANVICGVTASKGLLSGDILAPVKAEEVSDEIPTVAADCRHPEKCAGGAH
jgi:hypothetical protein